jgi:Flp pilus assembly protein TadG
MLAVDIVIAIRAKSVAMRSPNDLLRKHDLRWRPGEARRAVAAVELAILLPLLTLLFVIGIDWARVFYYDLTIWNCARQGALYGSGAASGVSVQQAALADATNLTPQPNVSSTTGTDANGNPTIGVTVTLQLPLVTNYPGVGNTVNLSRTVWMRIAN